MASIRKQSNGKYKVVNARNGVPIKNGTNLTLKAAVIMRSKKTNQIMKTNWAKSDKVYTHKSHPYLFPKYKKRS